VCTVFDASAGRFFLAFFFFFEDPAVEGCFGGVASEPAPPRPAPRRRRRLGRPPGEGSGGTLTGV